MDSLQNILLGRGKKRDEPPEVAIIKDYALDTFQEHVQVTAREKEIIITCHSAALAGSFRMHAAKLKKLCKTEKRLVFRIG